ncbi:MULTISPECIES: nicotinate-nucleotide adenylyltransferase [unclassified Granulicatella]|uniref:nicotinate-nucleotide adenylyltransferase n=1 Tax=unclassified Granulicatella TaxID=2630493 RepID=UPI00107394A8|nr:MULTISPECIES: nicotinate-nucleotide adenylyltransferase [unclassified Granulicatella]MBF0780090.1 nicotinate-nucleotide adenylyltransferase [Granulicatella sp. 19428wC4_WM01]TFU95816.1 nicotinate-nucleotide adenylyltransferase [Granulicatella sp. WM01]
MAEIKRVGILGGTFNPPHIAHLICAQCVGETLRLDKVYFMPSAIPPHKNGKQTIDSQHREEMVHLAIEHNPLFDIEMYEVIKGGVNYTYDTIQYLKRKHGNSEIYFIIGADMIENLPTWYRINELVNDVNFVGVNRPGYDMESVYPIISLEVPSIEISSSYIREQVRLNKSIQYLVPKCVDTYIQEKGLYQ